MNFKLKLGINIDHVATIRNARGVLHPDPLKAALIALRASFMETFSRIDCFILGSTAGNPPA